MCHLIDEDREHQDWQSGELKVVVNHEGQYSIWPIHRTNPPGWNDGGRSGSKTECLEYIEEVWTDMRPLSLVKHMEEVARSQEDGNSPEDRPAEPRGPSLVDRLAASESAVEWRVYPEGSTDAMQRAIDRGFVQLMFSETQGGTQLGVRLLPELTRVSTQDIESRTGSAVLVGELTLDGTRVRCTADIDITSRQGRGRLEIVANA